MTTTRANPWGQWRRTACLALALGMVAWSDSSAAPRIRTGNTAADAASESGDEQKLDPKVAAKLDQILADQERIKAQLDKVMEELQIVKIRATVR